MANENLEYVENKRKQENVSAEYRDNSENDKEGTDTLQDMMIHLSVTLDLTKKKTNDLQEEMDKLEKFHETRHSEIMEKFKADVQFQEAHYKEMIDALSNKCKSLLDRKQKLSTDLEVLLEQKRNEEDMTRKALLEIQQSYTQQIESAHSQWKQEIRSKREELIITKTDQLKMATRKALEPKIDKLKQSHTQDLIDVRYHYEQEKEQLEAAISSEYEQLYHSYVETKEKAASEAAQRIHEYWTQQISAVNAGHSQALIQARDHYNAMSLEQRLTHESRLTNMKNDHKEQLSKIHEKHRKEITDYELQGKYALESLSTQQKKAIELQELKFRTEGDGENCSKFEQDRQELFDQRDSMIFELVKTHESDRLLLEKEMFAVLDQKMRQLQKDYDEHIGGINLRLKCREELKENALKELNQLYEELQILHRDNGNNEFHMKTMSDRVLNYHIEMVSIRNKYSEIHEMMKEEYRTKIGLLGNQKISLIARARKMKQALDELEKQHKDNMSDEHQQQQRKLHDIETRVKDEVKNLDERIRDTCRQIVDFTDHIDAMKKVIKFN